MPGTKISSTALAKRAQADFLVDLPELAGQIERGGPRGFAAKSRTLILSILTSDAARNEGPASGLDVDPSSR